MVAVRRRSEGPEDGWQEAEIARRPRRDALPEHTHYNDTGCDLHPSCLTCPLVRCRYDEPGGSRRLFSDERDRSILTLHGEGIGIDETARRHGVSRRTVFRVLARHRDRADVEEIDDDEDR